MRFEIHQSKSLFVVLFGATLLAGCIRRLPDADPADIPMLEEALQASPEDGELLTRLGIALYKSESHEQAIEVLERASVSDEPSGAAFLYLGLAAEALEDWPRARDAYSSYMDVGRFDPVKDELQDRLQLIIRNALATESRQTLAMEDSLSSLPPTPGTVAVFPFYLVNEDREDLKPLQVAMADMMTTDLELSGAVQVLERTRVQGLLTEMALEEAGYTEPGTGAQAGRMLRSEHVIQGTLTILGQDGLRFDADVLQTEQGSSAGEVTSQRTLNELFILEKEVVFDVLDALGVEITPAEREAINENRAANLQAFLAYGEGLTALDQGNFTEAAAAFGRSVQADPSFQAAQQGQTQAGQLETSSSQSSEEFAAQSQAEMDAPVGAAQEDAIGLSPGDDLLTATKDDLVPSPASQIVNLGAPESGASQQAEERDATQEATNSDGVTQATTATLRITVKRPGSGGGGS